MDKCLAIKTSMLLQIILQNYGTTNLYFHVGLSLDEISHFNSNLLVLLYNLFLSCI